MEVSVCLKVFRGCAATVKRTVSHSRKDWMKQNCCAALAAIFPRRGRYAQPLHQPTWTTSPNNCNSSTVSQSSERIDRAWERSPPRRRNSSASSNPCANVTQYASRWLRNHERPSSIQTPPCDGFFSCSLFLSAEKKAAIIAHEFSQMFEIHEYALSRAIQFTTSERERLSSMNKSTTNLTPHFDFQRELGSHRRENTPIGPGFPRSASWYTSRRKP